VTRHRFRKLGHEDQRGASETDHDPQPVGCRNDPHLSEWGERNVVSGMPQTPLPRSTGLNALAQRL
jgi:hypothetical protein